MINKITEFIKRETVLCISAILAIISMFFVPPSAGYLGYIDFRTLALLFCLMAVMAGFREIGVFSSLANLLLKRAKNFRSISLILIMLCFFTSMLITNDVALITFVPFAIEVVRKSNNTQHLVPIVVLQTIAANLGSMLTPMGNPQNLYLYSLSEMSLADFIILLLPYTVISFILLIIFNFSAKPSHIEYKVEKIDFSVKLALFYAAMFLICMLTVGNILDYKICFVIIAVTLLIFKRNLLLRIDYSLLMTFIFFFIFIGNMGNIEAFKHLILSLLNGREMIASVAASQFISNVPTAVLLSGFTRDYNNLIVGVNLGGLGTLIASMASLISYNFFVATAPDMKGRYIAKFTLWNIIFLIILLLYYFIF